MADSDPRQRDSDELMPNIETKPKSYAEYVLSCVQKGEDFMLPLSMIVALNARKVQAEEMQENQPVFLVFQEDGSVEGCQGLKKVPSSKNVVGIYSTILSANLKAVEIIREAIKEPFCRGLPRTTKEWATEHNDEIKAGSGLEGDDTWFIDEGGLLHLRVTQRTSLFRESVKDAWVERRSIED
ncbi:hypothetical protein JX266_009457 [Neoarthrinium moseri]|nr:hypothetical protein JX266_009457 [Neoarthrinium moseri]